MRDEGIESQLESRELSWGILYPIRISIMTSNNSDQLTYETKQQIDNFRFLFQSKAILSKSQVRIVERRNTRGIREMYDQIDRLEYCIRKNERSRIDEERHIKRILFEIEKQKRGEWNSITYHPSKEFSQSI